MVHVVTTSVASSNSKQSDSLFEYFIPISTMSVSIDNELPIEESCLSKGRKKKTFNFDQGLQSFVDCFQLSESNNNDSYNPQKHCYIGLKNFNRGNIANCYVNILSLITYKLPISSTNTYSSFGIQLSTSLKSNYIKDSIREFLISIFESKETSVIDTILDLDGIQVISIVGRDLMKKKEKQPALIMILISSPQ